ncbi:MAG: TonB-dependent receptor [Candidatus Binatia bacterium]
MTCVMVSTLPCPVRAADEPAQRELLLFEEQDVSAAMKHPQRQREAPSSVTVVTSEEIRRLGYRTLAEALRGVRGFYVTGDRNYDYLGVRGFSRPGDYNDRILLLVDGHTYNDDIYQTAPIGNDFGIDLEAVERIEVIRGPGSALYGGNAVFAVINVVTFDGATKPGVHARLETGSFWRKRAQLSVGHVTEYGLSVFASGSVLDLDGQNELYYPEFNDPSTNDGVAEEADGERALNFFLKARWGDFTLEGGVNQRDKHIPTGSFGTTFDDNGTQTTDGKRFADLSYAHSVTPTLHLSARAYYDGYNYHGTYIYAGDDGSRIKNEDRAWSNWFGSEMRARWEAWDERNTLTVGAEYNYHPGAHQENFDLPGHATYLDDRREFGSWGIFAQDELKVTPYLTLVAGLRFDRYYDRDQQVTPRAAVIWTVLEGTTVKMLYGQAFRPPNLYEQYYAYPGSGIATVANPHIDSERITTYEGVLEQRLPRGAQATFALYHYDMHDLIEAAPVMGVDGEPTSQFENGDTVRAHGGELELRVPLPRGIALKTSYCLQRAETRTGRLSNSPQHLGNLTLLFPIGWGLEGGAELVVVGPRDTRDGRRLETARIVNLNLEYTSPVPGLGGSLGLYNILDHTYPDPAGGEHVMDRIPQNGFTFRTQLHYAF